MNEKFSFLVVKKGLTASAKYESEDQAETPAEKSFFWPRMIRPVLKRQKHSIIDLCSPGRDTLERRIIAKSHGVEGGYRKVKKLKWGDLWYFERRVPNKYRKEGRFGKRLW